MEFYYYQNDPLSLGSILVLFLQIFYLAFIILIQDPTIQHHLTIPQQSIKHNSNKLMSEFMMHILFLIEVSNAMED